MNIYFSIIILLTATVLNTSCTKSNKPQTESDSVSGSSKGVAKTSEDTSSKKLEFKEKNLEAVYGQYVLLTNALVNGDVVEAKIAANAIEAGSSKVNDGREIAASAAIVTNAPDIEAQRTAYFELSKQIVALIKKEGLQSGELYIESCPMAFNNNGAFWVSRSKEIRNPYFGEAMLNCGQVKETLR